MSRTNGIGSRIGAVVIVASTLMFTVIVGAPATLTVRVPSPALSQGVR